MLNPLNQLSSFVLPASLVPQPMPLDNSSDRVDILNGHLSIASTNDTSEDVGYCSESSFSFSVDADTDQTPLKLIFVVRNSHTCVYTESNLRIEKIKRLYQRLLNENQTGTTLKNELTLELQKENITFKSENEISNFADIIDQYNKELISKIPNAINKKIKDCFKKLKKIHRNRDFEFFADQIKNEVKSPRHPIPLHLIALIIREYCQTSRN